MQGPRVFSLSGFHFSCFFFFFYAETVAPERGLLVQGERFGSRMYVRTATRDFLFYFFFVNFLWRLPSWLFRLIASRAIRPDMRYQKCASGRHLLQTLYLSVYL